jgi:two-component system alkaline phosphatase synthesis response regulator PhoP
VVLVVDDEPDIRTLIKINLEAAGYSVVTAASGAEALERVRADPPDAMFLDVMMPGIDGWAVLAELKATRSGAGSDIPVFLVTALHDPELRLRSGIEGALRFITKPFDPGELVRALEQVLDPAAPSERELRRRVQASALEALARSERVPGFDRVADDGAMPRVRLTRLEHVPTAPVPAPRVRRSRELLGSLTPKQRRLVEELATGVSVAATAQHLGTSRSNVYASLRRICRKLGLKGTHELLVLARQGTLSGEP